MEADKDKLLRNNLIEGKKNAFEEIYETYWEDLYIYVARILDHESDVEDIVQEVFVKLWRIKDKIHQIDSLKAYLLIMAKNTVFKYLSKKQNRLMYEGRLQEFANVQHLDPEQEFYSTQLANIIDVEIASLPTKMQRIFLLSRKHQLSHKEIATLLQISDQTVKKQINNSLRYLKERIRKII